LDKILYQTIIYVKLKYCKVRYAISNKALQQVQTNYKCYRRNILIHISNEELTMDLK